MTSIKCFLLEPTDRASQELRRFASGTTCSTVTGCHGASVRIEDVDDSPERSSGDLHQHDDPRWPTACACGYVFAPGDAWQLFTRTLYRHPDTGELLSLHRLPNGAIYDATWLHDVEEYKGRSPDGRVLIVQTPGGPWVMDGPSSAGGYWTRTGTLPRITVRPSILIGGYHAFLTDGVLVSC